MRKEEFLFFLLASRVAYLIQKGNALVSYRFAVVPQHPVARNLVSKDPDEKQIYPDVFTAKEWVAAEGVLVRTMWILALWLEKGKHLKGVIWDLKLGYEW
eukprot:CAMPEP_0117441548 /NCGR_PEP_ID=MMETSP0759-20121206/3691_1 /TAXON_ID=63605 /ORGANISM="Percolomonas cosmopolitus, Strain WS" /LENGTH=99 /DNA_ID=CAMNT_0005233405 /DNA_START=408 /DNA_END=704 /DNA_ORIENTATION=+